MGTTMGHTNGIADGVSLAGVDGTAEGSGVKSMPVSENGLSVELLEELAASWWISPARETSFILCNRRSGGCVRLGLCG